MASDADRPGLYALLAEAYGGVSGLAHQLGYLDLRALVIERIEQAAWHAADRPYAVVTGRVAAWRWRLRPGPGTDGPRSRRPGQDVSHESWHAQHQVDHPG